MCKSNAPEVLRALDQVEEIQICLNAVSDLLTPEPDFAAASRDNVACLVSYLVSAQKDAQHALRKILFGGATC